MATRNDAHYNDYLTFLNFLDYQRFMDYQKYMQYLDYKKYMQGMNNYHKFQQHATHLNCAVRAWPAGARPPTRPRRDLQHPEGVHAAPCLRRP